MAAISTKSITDNGKDISLMAPKAASKNKFCEIWPGAKTALELLQSIVKNPFLKLTIGGVIAAGDVVAGKIC